MVVNFLSIKKSAKIYGVIGKMCELRNDNVSGVRLHRTECSGSTARPPVKPVKPVFMRVELDETLRCFFVKVET